MTLTTETQAQQFETLEGGINALCALLGVQPMFAAQSAADVQAEAAEDKARQDARSSFDALLKETE